MNEAEVYFGLIGDIFDPMALTDFLGIEPSRTKIKADPRPKNTFWILSTGKVEAEVVDVEALSSSLIDKLMPLKERINEAKEMFKVEPYLEVVLSITTNETKPTPIVGFDSTVIGFLNYVGATIDIDIYRNQ